MTEYLQVITTTDSKDIAQTIAKHLLEKRLAGCVQVSGPVTSSYWWNGKIETSEEWYCMIKTTTASYKAVEREIIAVHSYDVPEIIAIPAANGSESYLNWLKDVIKPPSQ